MLGTTSARIRRAVTTLLFAAGLMAIGTVPAGAAPPGWQSGWKADTSSYGKGCNAKVFYGRSTTGQAYAYGTSTNPACYIRVKIIPTGGYAGATSNWGRGNASPVGTVGTATPGNVPKSAAIWIEVWIPAFGSYISGNVWMMP